jgi:hypothetical protein
VSPAGKLRRIIAARQEEDCRQEEPIIRVGKEGYGTRGEKGIT